MVPLTGRELLAEKPDVDAEGYDSLGGGVLKMFRISIVSSVVDLIVDS